MIVTLCPWVEHCSKVIENNRMKCYKWVYIKNNLKVQYIFTIIRVNGRRINKNFRRWSEKSPTDEITLKRMLVKFKDQYLLFLSSPLFTPLFHLRSCPWLSSNLRRVSVTKKPCCSLNPHPNLMPRNRVANRPRASLELMSWL